MQVERATHWHCPTLATVYGPWGTVVPFGTGPASMSTVSPVQNSRRVLLHFNIWLKVGSSLFRLLRPAGQLANSDLWLDSVPKLAANDTDLVPDPPWLFVLFVYLFCRLFVHLLDPNSHLLDFPSALANVLGASIDQLSGRSSYTHELHEANSK